MTSSTRGPGAFEMLPGREAPLPPEQLDALPLPDKLREVDLTLRPDRERAVDTLELAAYLEADGLSDESLRDRYGAGGLFAAAETLYAQRGTGRALERPREEAVPPFPWYLAQRGPLYLLPGACGVLISGAAGSGASIAFVFAAAFGWGYSMLLARIRYAEPFGTPGAALRLALAVATLTGLVGGGLLAALMVGQAHWAWGVLLGGTVAVSGAAAGVLLSLDQRGQVAGAFALPLLLGGMVYVWPHPVLQLLALAALSFSPLLLALRATREPGQLPAEWSTFRPGLGLALYGWALAAAFVALSHRLGGWVMLPVILSAGLLEAGVWNAQQGLQHTARTRSDFAQVFWEGSRQVLGTALLYGLLLVAGLALLVPLPLTARQINLAVLLTIPAFGMALLLSTWLANQRREGLLLAIWAGYSLLLALGVSPPLLSAPLILVLLPLTFVTLRDLRSYR